MNCRAMSFCPFDTAFHKRKADLDSIGMKVCLPKNTGYLPSEYRQNILESGTATCVKRANPAMDVPGSTLFQRMDNLLRTVIQVPKAEIDRREKEWKRKNGKRLKKLLKG